MARGIMIIGTGPGVGRRTIAAGMCSLFRDMKIRVVPFSAVSVTGRTVVTNQGEEMARAQAEQAVAAGLTPCSAMNPVLLKPVSESRYRVFFDGKFHAEMSAPEFDTVSGRAWAFAQTARDRLGANHDLFVMEAGWHEEAFSDRNRERFTMRAARDLRAPVVLVGEADREGGLASLHDVLVKMGEGFGVVNYRDMVTACVVNRFQGSLDDLRPKLRRLESETGVPVIGVVDYQGAGSGESMTGTEWAALLRARIDLCFVLRQVGMEACMSYLKSQIREQL
ncbi:MAG: AAA family ATPase [Nitrospiraceae bacterium]|nr:MAG: AAA family ATPase [Nitrospiraceae bacterium]